MNDMSQLWLAPLDVAPAAKQAVVCFPQAGAGTSAFGAWPAAAGDEVGVWAVQLPGRERRLSEPPSRTVDDVATQVARAIAALPVDQVSLFGHCSGAVVAYEVARRLAVNHLFVSGQPAPAAAELKPDTVVHRLPLPRLIEHLRHLGGTRPEVLEHEELMELMEPAIRADFEMIETYPGPAEPVRLEIPITAFGGRSDSLVAPERIMPWYRFTSAAFSLHLLAGDHFFLDERPDEVVAALVGHLMTGGKP